MDNDGAQDISVRVKQQADKYIPASTDRTVRFVVWMAGGIILLTGIATWNWFALKEEVRDMKRRIIEFDKVKEMRDEQYKAQQIANTATEKIFDERKARIDELRKDVDKLTIRVDKLEPIVTYIDTLRKFGISFKEDYLREHHEPAPSNPQAEIQPRRPNNNN